MSFKPNLIGRLRAAGRTERSYPIGDEALRALCREAADELELRQFPIHSSMHDDDGEVSFALTEALSAVWRKREGKGLDDLEAHLLAELKRRGYVVAVQVRQPEMRSLGGSGR